MSKSPYKLPYRLALDLGSTSLGWALIRLGKSATDTENPPPIAIVKAGVRIFGDGRNPKDGSSLAVTRREARAMRRRRDRLLKRKERMLRQLIDFGFFSKDDATRKAAERLNPFELRAKGLDHALAPHEFARALFHINQRRGFKSNRKTDKKENDASALKGAIAGVRQALIDSHSRTVGEWLFKRQSNGQSLRARNNGLKNSKLVYDLYIDRAMIEAEFDALWSKQSQLNPMLFTAEKGAALKDTLLFQRPLKPVRPGRCTLMPEEERAPLALPSQQRFRIYQEVNNLRILREGLVDEPLTLAQRDLLIGALERNSKRSFTQIKKILGLGGAVQFNFEDPKRTELKGNTTSTVLSKKEHFGEAWFKWTERQQDAIVRQLVAQQSLGRLVIRLIKYCLVDEARAEAIANAGLPEGYGSLSAKALAKILPALRADVVTYDKAVLAAFDHHSHISHAATGEILSTLPYYAEYLTRHVGFGTGNPNDAPEKQYGKIPNPTVHIGLNQVRTVVNALIKRYGHPSEVIVEVANELKRRKDHRPIELQKGKIELDKGYRRYCSCAGCVQVRQSVNQKNNEEFRKLLLENSIRPTEYFMEKMKIWFDMGGLQNGVIQCPYSGETLGLRKALSSEVEIDHILPHQRTLDDSLANKVLCITAANRIKKDKTPFEAKATFEERGWLYEDILSRVKHWDQKKRFRFNSDAMEIFLHEHKNFLARALNDTRYLSRVAREYLSLICPQNTRVIPGQMTAMLRGRFGLNNILGLDGEKNRNDHRHHAVDACVIGVTDQGMLQRFARASASARERQLDRLVEAMPDPWSTYREHVRRAVSNIWVSHKPDHGYGGEMFDQTIYNASGYSRSAAKVRQVLPFATHPKDKNQNRHGHTANGQPKVYRGLLSNSNYCIEIVRGDHIGQWRGEVIPTYQANQAVAQAKTPDEGWSQLRNKTLSLSKHPLVMRLSIGDYIRIEVNAQTLTLQVLKINSSGSITFIKPNETNVPARYLAKLAAQKAKNEGAEFDPIALNDLFFQQAFSASSLYQYKARQVTISPIGELRDIGFKG